MLGEATSLHEAKQQERLSARGGRICTQREEDEMLRSRISVEDVLLGRALLDAVHRVVLEVVDRGREGEITILIFLPHDVVDRAQLGSVVLVDGEPDERRPKLNTPRQNCFSGHARARQSLVALWESSV